MVSPRGESTKNWDNMPPTLSPLVLSPILASSAHRYLFIGSMTFELTAILFLAIEIRAWDPGSES